MIRSTPSRLAPCLVLALVLAGCGDADDSVTAVDGAGAGVERYPTLAAAFGLERDDIDRLVAAGAGRSITPETVKTFVIGTGVRRDTSEYLNRPILDIAALAADNWLDKNLASASREVSSIKLETNKRATDDSWQFKQSFKESLSYIGFGGQSAHDSDEKDQKLSSSGESTVRFSRVNSGGYIRILEGNFRGPADLSRYLVGNVLSPTQVKQYVDYDQCAMTWLSSQRYVCALRIQNGGRLSATGENVYGSIQVLGEMQAVFALARGQYEQYADPVIRQKLLEVMQTLRALIRERISDFYANNGQAFVSEIALMNEAKALGTLNFSENSGRNEHRTGVAVSVGYQGLLGGASFSADVQKLKVTGWANSFKNISVEASSVPALDGVDTLAWAQEIMRILNSESSPISVPAISGLPGIADLQLPPLAERKPLLEPPMGTFTTYEAWKEYKAEVEGPELARKAKIADAARLVKDKALNVFRRQAVMKADEPDAAVDHRAVDEELDRLQAIRGTGPLRATAGSPGDSNIMRVDKQFVSGFRTIDYERVIPQLRPDLEIPGQAAPAPALFETITVLRMLVDRVDDAASYVRFLGNVPASRVSPDMADKFAAFSRLFRQKAFALIAIASINGVDLNPLTAETLIDDLFGRDDGSNRADSALYRQFADIDLYNYFRFAILEPRNIAVWADAPGGYIPFHFRREGAADIVAHHNVTGVGYAGGRPYVRWLENFPYGDPTVNPLDFYGARTSTGDAAIALQTPWYPIFQFNRAKPSSLVFLQMAGPNHIVYGRKYVVMPVASSRSDSTTSPDFRNPNPVSPGAQLSEAMLQRIGEPENSFEKACGGGPGAGYTTQFSLYFPQSTPDPVRAERFRALVLPVGPECHPGFANPPTDNGYEAVNWIDGYRGFNVEWMSGSARIPYLLDGNGTPVSLFRFWGNQTGRAFVVLLPINATTGQSRFDNAYRWGAARTLESLVRSDDYQDLVTARLLQ